MDLFIPFGEDKKKRKKFRSKKKFVKKLFFSCLTLSQKLERQKLFFDKTFYLDKTKKLRYHKLKIKENKKKYSFHSKMLENI